MDIQSSDSLILGNIADAFILVFQANFSQKYDINLEIGEKEKYYIILNSLEKSCLICNDTYNELKL